MKLYPLFTKIEGKLTVVVGGGKVALRKIKDLRDAGAMVRVVSPIVDHEITIFGKSDTNIEIIEREYKEGDLDGALLVYAATNNSDINRQIYLEAEAKNVFVNSVDDPENCSFFVPSMSRYNDLVLAVSTTGVSPAFAAKLRRELENHIPKNIEDILAALKTARAILKENDKLDFSQRGHILKKIVRDDRLLDDLIRSMKKNEIEKFLEKFMQNS